MPGTVIEEIPLPESTDDYAKALQEAYRRGAEAAARMQQQSQLMSASCPNLQQFQGQPNDPTMVNSYVPNPLSNHVSVPASPAPPPPPPQNAMPVSIPQTVPHPQPQHIQMQVMHQVPPPQQPPALQHPMNATPTPQAAGSRSLSLPDMQSYAARANAEEEKRKKRLARNRASARLRRLRKKNLVRGMPQLSLMRIYKYIQKENNTFYFLVLICRLTHTKVKLEYWKQVYKSLRHTHGELRMRPY
jgi:hypothetical protein